MNLAVYEITDSKKLTSVDPTGMSDEWFTDSVVRWIKITSAGPADVEPVLRPLELQPRIGEECVSPYKGPQALVLERALFMMIPVWTHDEMVNSCVRLLFVPTTLITIQEEPIPAVEEVAGDLQDDKRLPDGGISALVVQVLEALLRATVPGYIALRNSVDAMAGALETDPSEVAVDDLIALKRRSSRLSNLLEDQLYCLMELQEAESETLQLDVV